MEFCWEVGRATDLAVAAVELWAPTVQHAVAACAAQVIGWQGPLRSCAIGFSAVIFGLKVILLHKEGQGEQNVWGMRVQNRWVPWAGKPPKPLITLHESAAQITYDLL